MRGICKLFLEERDLVEKSHIIPNFFTKDLMVDSGFLIKIGDSYKNNLKMQTSVFEKYIFSLEAEQKLSKLEHYGRQLILDTPPNLRIAKEGNQQARYFTWDNFDYDKLKLFLISILWRCSISTREETKNISLGIKHEEQARQLLLGNKAPDDGQFDIIIKKLVLDKPNPDDLKKTILKSIILPTPTRVENIKFYSFSVGGYTFYIKCDSTRSTSNINNFVLKRGQAAIVLEKDFYQSLELETLKELAQKRKSKI